MRLVPEEEFTSTDMGSGETTETGMLPDGTVSPPSIDSDPGTQLEIPEVEIHGDNTSILFKDPSSAVKYKTYYGKVYQGQPLDEKIIYRGDNPIIRYTVEVYCKHSHITPGGYTNFSIHFVICEYILKTLFLLENIFYLCRTHF